MQKLIETEIRRRKTSAIGHAPQERLVNAALEFVLAHRLEKGAALVQTAVAALHAFTLDGVGHLLDLQKNVTQVMAHRAFAQGVKVHRKFAHIVAVLPHITQIAQQDAHDDRHRRNQHPKTKIHRQV